jgi:hypothetical protein
MGKIQLKSIFLLSFSFLAVAPVYAQTHEILTEVSGGNLSFSSGFTGLYGSIGYRYALTDELQLGSRLRFSYSDYESGSSTYLSLAAGPVYNFGGTTLADSYFADLQLALSRNGGSSTTETDTTFAFSAAVGKRFPITDSVTYNPDVFVSRILEDGADLVFGINFFSLSVLF